MIKNRVRLKAIRFLFSVLQLKEFYKNSKLLKLPKKLDQHFKVKKKTVDRIQSIQYAFDVVN